MKLVVDIHLHSHFSRATSKNLNLENLYKWAQLKGIHVVGTGDIAHPGWLAEMKEKLEPAEDGLFRLKKEYADAIQSEVFKACRGPVRFMLAGEISNIYKKNDKVRKIHNVVFMPSFDAVEKFQGRLEKIGNIRSDGRPILGLDSRDLLEIVLETDPQGYFIPAHIWTPWFALLGSRSGFDSVEESFEDLTEHIFALETGLSSDPPMNWRLSILDRYTLVSNSDAHSPPKLGREANVFNTELSYSKIFDALKTGNPDEFLGTIEFFPEEGKYHYDGHRKCGVRWNPKTTLANDGICSECGRPVTVGVMHRVEKLADRQLGEKPVKTHPYKSLIPLAEVLSEIHQVGVNTKRVNGHLEVLLSKLGSELNILQDIPLEELEKLGGSLLSEGIRRMRNGEVKIAAGFDGEFGKIHLFEENERQKFSSQIGFFEEQLLNKKKKTSPKKSLKFSVRQDKAKYKKPSHGDPQNGKKNGKSNTNTQNEVIQTLKELNPEQQEAVQHTDGPLVIVAGPGTGKTKTLTHRIAYLISEKQVDPQNILAVTFTNKAAQEMSERLTALLGPQKTEKLSSKTFHAFGAQILFESGDKIGIDPSFSICGEQDRITILRDSFPFLNAKEINRAAELISQAKNQLLTPETFHTLNECKDFEGIEQIYGNYQRELLRNQTLDYDDLIFYPVKLFEESHETLKKYQQRFQWILVDEYQDINFAQYQLLRLLTTDNTHICVIGDPDQAIYGFRGADRKYFLKFQEDFPTAKVVSLTQNYRSSQIILDAASQIISKSPESKNAKIWSDFISQTKIEIYAAPTDSAEAEYVVHQIESMMGGTSYFSLDSGRVADEGSTPQTTFCDFAVLYRLNTQSRLLQEAFQRSGIPYQTIGEMSLYEKPEIKNILAYLWFVINPDSNLHLQNILTNAKNNIGPARLETIRSLVKEKEITLWQAIQNESTFLRLEISQRKAVREFVKRLTEFLKIFEDKNPAQLIELVLDQFFDENSFDEKTLNLVNQLILRSKQYDKNLREFLESTVWCREYDYYDPRADRVTLMTLHAAKGLEFQVVFIIGCEETLIPYEKDGSIEDLEEERRLFYVGMTRAQEKLILTHSKSRLLFGEKKHSSQSCFLNDVDDALKELKQMQSPKKHAEKSKDSQMKLF